MREAGELVDWNDDRGFGFIQRPGGSDRIFVHVKSIRQSHARPRIGDRLSYAVGPGRNGKLAACDVDIAIVDRRPRTGREPRLARDFYRVWGAIILSSLLLIDVLVGRMPFLGAAAYFLIGVGTFALYGADKMAAEGGAHRISENKLHLLDFGAGIIGGLLAQQIFRHKTAKPGFAATTCAIAALHAAVLVTVLFGIITPEAIQTVLMPPR